MQLWEEMVKTALLGTERQALSLQSAEPFLQPLLTQLPTEERERTLLAAAGTLALVRRAGQLAAPAPAPLLAPAENDAQLLCREAASNDLALLLNGEYESLLPEWLALVGAQGHRVPERWLPALLERGARNKELRLRLLPVLGKRGRWLALQNPEWQFGAAQTTAEPSEESWELGLLPERVAYLSARRRQSPTEAREQLESVWAQEPFEVRAALLPCLEYRLSHDDEPFLESALDDRRKEVRSVAQELLRRLPASRLCQRMTQRVQPLLLVTGIKLLGQHLEVVLPAAHDKTMTRDGIEEKPPAYPKLGERAFWLRELLAATPLSFWTEHLKHSPERLVGLAAAHKEWGELVLEGWSRRLSAEPSPDWAEALLAHWLTPSSGPLSVSIPWSAALPKKRLEALVSARLDFHLLVNHVPHSATLRTVLSQCGPTWSPALAERFLEGYREHSGKKQGDYYLLHSLQEFADFFPEERLPALYALWEESAQEHDYYRQQRERHLARTQLRQELRKHILGV